MIRNRATVCVFLALLVLPAGATVAERKSLIEVAGYWQIAVIPMLDQQKRAFEQSLHRPKNAEFAYHLGLAYQQQGNADAAILELERSLRLAKEKGEFSGIENAKTLLQQLSNK